MRLPILLSNALLITLSLHQPTQSVDKQIIKLNGHTIILNKVTAQAAKRYSFKSSMDSIKTAPFKKIKGVIKLQLRNGSFTTFKDKYAGTDNPDQKVYQLKGILTDRFYVFMVTYYETLEYQLINKNTGKTKAIWGEPYISPDGSHLATWSGSTDEMPNGIQLFKITDDGIVLEWQYAITDWQPNAIAWKDAKTLLVEKLTSNSTLKKDVKSYLEISFD